MRTLLSILFVTFLFAKQTPFERSKLANEHYGNASGFIKEKKYDQAIDELKKFLDKRPLHTTILRVLGELYLELNDTETAFSYFEKASKIGSIIDPKRIEAWSKLPQKYAQQIEDYNKKNSSSITKSKVVFEVPVKGLVIESVVYDKTLNSFFLSSVYDRNIYVYKDGNFKQLTNNKSLWAMHSLRLDSKGIWASTSSIKQMKNDSEEKIGPAGIIHFNKQDGSIKNKYILDDGEEHIFGDFILDNDIIYVSDSKQNQVYVLDTKTGKFTKLVADNYFVSLQGLVLNGRNLIVADYSFGLFTINLNTKEVAPIESSEHIELKGIDGLYSHYGVLIATQNGFRPNRILKLKINKALTHINDFEILSMNMKEIDDPTLGNIVDGTFYYVGNSQWSLFNRDGSRKPITDVVPNYILKVSLN